MRRHRKFTIIIIIGVAINRTFKIDIAFTV
jgi:hypothetical protein